MKKKPNPRPTDGPSGPVPSSVTEIAELIVDAYGCEADLSDVTGLERVARRAVESVGAHVVGRAHHSFQPHGLTLCLILKESHCIVSTWPEHRLAIVNLFLCNPAMDAKLCWATLAAWLKPHSAVFHDVRHQVSPAGAKALAAL